jgi:beta-lactam-binding protein with PASTA domain
VVVVVLVALAAFYVLDLELVDRDAPPEVSTTTVTTTAAADAAVPCVIGLSYPDARAAIEAAGLFPIVKGGYSSDFQSVVNVGTQSPSAGTQVDEGSGVTIWAK